MFLKLKIITLSILGLIFFPYSLGLAKPTSAEQTLAKSNTAFAVALYQKLADQSKRNIFFSPYSISSALAMVYAGAQSDTEKQMQKVLQFSLNQKKLHPAFNQLQTRLNKLANSKKMELNIANSIWPSKQLQLAKNFLSLIKTHYGVEVTQLDFTKNKEVARKKINQWVEVKTKEKIKNLISKETADKFNKNTFVLVNAVYFKGAWKKEFNPSYTNEDTFHLTNKTTIKVPFMNLNNTFDFADLGSLKMIKLPYEAYDEKEKPFAEKELTMVILLPKKIDGLKELEQKLSLEKLLAWQNNLVFETVNVSLPSFKITSDFSLRDTLSSMGMKNAFDRSKANFTGIAKNISIDEVIHKTFIDVKEKGTKAAATTAVLAIPSAKPHDDEPAKPKIFRADRPFLFLIQEKSTGSVLFMGRVLNPKE